MKPKAFLILLQIFCLLPVIHAKAPIVNAVVKFSAFVQETVAGNVQVDDKGNQMRGVDHLHYLYAETTGKILPQWNVVYTNSGAFAIQAEEIDSAKITVGTLKKTGKPVIVTHKKGNRLWKLILVPIKARTPENITALLKKNDVVVTTQFKGKPFTHTIAKEIELETLFYP